MVPFAKVFPGLTPPVVKKLLLDEFDMFADHIDALAKANN